MKPVNLRLLSLLFTAALSSAAWGQFGGILFPGMVTLPDDDFTWLWGDINDANRGRFPDITAAGGEMAFNCTLEAQLSPGSRLTSVDTRAIEINLGSSLTFIQDAASVLNTLDFDRDLRWGRLACAKKIPTDDDEEEAQERLDKAMERAIRERERRRAREARDNN